MNFRSSYLLSCMWHWRHCAGLVLRQEKPDHVVHEASPILLVLQGEG